MLTNDETVALGLFGQGLLAHDGFNRLVQEFEQNTALAILATKPEQTAMRERLHAEYSGVGALIGFIADVAKQAADLVAEPELPDETEIELPTIFD